MVRKTMQMFLVVLLAAAVICESAVEKEKVLGKLLEKYQGNEWRGSLEINTATSGNQVKVPCRFWVKGKRVRLDMVMSQPGLEEAGEQNILIDEKSVTIYQKKLGLVMKLDFTRLPEELRKPVKDVQVAISPEEMWKQILSLGDRLQVSEKVKEGRNYYLIEVNEIGEIVKDLPFLKKQETEGKISKISLWVTSADYSIERVEVFSNQVSPVIGIDFKELVKEKIPDSVFNLKIPSNVQVLDITEMLLRMTEAKKQETK